MAPKNKLIPIPLALKRGQETLFGDHAAHCPLTREEKRIEKLIAQVRIEKLMMRWTLENENLEPNLSVNDVLDRFLDARSVIAAKLKKLGYRYTKDEEDHPHYEQFASKIKKPMAIRMVLDIDNPPF